MSYADRVIALYQGRVVADAPASSLDASAIEQIYAKNGKPVVASSRR